MSLEFILRLIMAVVFAATAVIFSELIPPIERISSFIPKAVVTILAGLAGFILFPEVATKITVITLRTFNIIVNRVSSELLSQMMRVPREPFHLPFTTQTAGGQVSLNRPLILDTSAIIDGRILDIAKTGFVYGTLLVPSSVLRELQQVADSSDFLKRSRGRRGFEIIEELKKVKGIRVEVWDKEGSYKGAVDDKLIHLAKNLHGRILTTDFNLNRVASVSNVAVLNVNDLANAVKTVAIPGERLKIKIMHLGKDTTQGVGYLDDGTMVVLADGATLVGKTVEVEVTKVLQIPAGRMIFTKKI